MLSKKFFAPTKMVVVPPLPGELYYKPIKRDATAASATVAGLPFAPALVISKGRNVSRDTAAFDTSRAALKRLNISTQQAEITDTDTLTAFGAAGFNVGTDTPGIINSAIGARFVNWAFAKAPGFMDVQTYTGDSTAGSLVTHNLGVSPDLVIAKCRSSAGLDWPVRVKSQSGDLYLNLAAGITPPAGNIEATPLTAVPSAAHAPAGTCMKGQILIAARAGTAQADYSTNAGISWSVITLPAIFGCIAFSPSLGLFVASSQYVSNGVFSSPDGLTWTQGVSTDFIGSNINWCNAEFLSTNNGHIYKSVNGTTWTKLTSPFPVTAGKGQWSCICYGNGVYVAVTAGDGGADKSTVNRCGAAYSSDGVTWAVADTASVLIPAITYLTKIAFGNGVFVATGPGGFALRNNHNVINDIVNTNAAQSYFSIDGITWTAMGVFPIAGNWGNLMFSDGQFLSVSSNTYGTAANYPSTAPAPSTATRAVIYSTDGATWHAGQLPTADFWPGLTYSDEKQRFYTVGNTGGAYNMLPNALSANMYNLMPTSVSLGSSDQTNMSGQTYVMYLFASMPGISKIGVYTGTGAINNVIECDFPTPPRFLMVKALGGISNWAVLDSARGIPFTGDSTYSRINTTEVEVTNGNFNATASGFVVDAASVGPASFNGLGVNYLFMAIA